MLKLIKNDENRTGHGIFECQCGTVKSIRKSAVKCGSTKSCGCHRRKIAIKNGKTVTTHGMSNTPVYLKWAGLNNLCDRWSKSFESFYDFIKEDWENGNTGIAIKDGFSVLSPESIILTSPSEAKNLNTIKTSVEKYGVKYPTQSKLVKDKINNTNIIKYGGNPSSTEVVKEKIRQTCLIRYGVDHYSKSDESKEKSKSKYRIHNGKSGKELSKEIGVSASHMNKMIREHGYEYAIQYERNYTFIETVVRGILDDLSVEYETHFKIEDKFADFYIPSKNIVIETDGLYWHSDAINKDNRYHLNKRMLYSDKGFRSLFFREDEIHLRTNAVKSIINNSLGLCEKVFARKCDLVDVNKNDREKFFNENHLMGVGKGSCFGLEYNGELICVMQYIKRNSYIDISRFCTKSCISVVGGFSKLIKKIEREFNSPSIQTFIDMRYGTGKYLNRLGFEKATEHISFRWIKNCESYHRMKFKGNSGYEYGYNKLWDCGQSRYIKN